MLVTETPPQTKRRETELVPPGGGGPLQFSGRFFEKFPNLHPPDYVLHFTAAARFLPGKHSWLTG